MKEVIIIEKKYSARMEQVLDESWKIFKSQFVNKKYEINSEAPFQFHFAQIIRSVGNLYSICNGDYFDIDLEKRCEDVRGKVKYIDITCGFQDKFKCAIELKFKTKRQSAEDLGRVDTYRDLEALEEMVIKKGYNLGKYYLITDNSIYTKKSDRGVGTEFGIHDNYHTETSREYHSNNKGLENIRVVLTNKYIFQWEKSKDWYFLELTVQRT